MVSIIIVSYNVRYYLEQCLRSVSLASKNTPVEVFVVDNDSKDGTIEYLSPRFPEVRFLENGENLGFGKANNIALSHVHGDYVLFLNPDTILSEHIIEQCTAFMDAHSDAGAVGVKMLHCNGKFAPESRRSVPTLFVSFCKMSGLSRMFPKSRLFARYHMSYLNKNETCPIEVISGAFMFVRHQVLDTVGGFDEAFFMYGEDIDLSFRILKEGFSNWYLPVPILHYKGESTEKTSYRYVKVFYDAMIIFFKKHYRHYSCLVTLLVCMLLSVKRVLSYIVNNLNSRSGLLDICNTERYLFVGSRQAADAVGEIMNRYGSEGSVSYVVADEKSLPEGHLTLEYEGYDYVVYDVESFSYDCILRALSMTRDNKLRLGTFSVITGVLLTEKGALL